MQNARDQITLDENIDKARKRLALILLIAALLMVAYLDREFFGAETVDLYEGAAFLGNGTAPAVRLSDGEAAVYFIDVGQGDCSLIMTGTRNILIDGGDIGEGDNLVGTLLSLGVGRLDCVIVTHPHDDHFGGLAEVLENIPVERLLLPELSESMLPRTRNYSRLLAAAELNGVRAEYARAGTHLELDGAVLEIISPTGNFSELNDMSIVARLIHGENAFLFTGDMELSAEKALLKADTELRADVLKVAHHGSAGSSGAEFLNAVLPEYAVIQASGNNGYGLPNSEALERLSAVGCRELYATSLNGNIAFISDGENICVESEKKIAFTLDKLL